LPSPKRWSGSERRVLLSADEPIAADGRRPAT
jgi:hypothetical protein